MAHFSGDYMNVLQSMLRERAGELGIPPELIVPSVSKDVRELVKRYRALRAKERSRRWSSDSWRSRSAAATEARERDRIEEVLNDPVLVNLLRDEAAIYGHRQVDREANPYCDLSQWNDRLKVVRRAISDHVKGLMK